MRREGKCVKIWGNVDHYWWDPYDWHAGLGAYIPGFGSVSDTDALQLVSAGLAKEFLMDSEWTQQGKGVYIINKFLWFDSYTFLWGEMRGGNSGAKAGVIKDKGNRAIRPSISPTIPNGR